MTSGRYDLTVIAVWVAAIRSAIMTAGLGLLALLGVTRWISGAA